MELIKLKIAYVRKRYKNLRNSFFSRVHDYFNLGYKEAKVYLFLYSIFKFDISLYRKEKESFYEMAVYKINKKEPIYFPRSKIIEKINDYMIYLKYKIVFSNNKYLNLLLRPYFMLKIRKQKEITEKIIALVEVYKEKKREEKYSCEW